MGNKLYFDNAATTMPSTHVLETLNKVAQEIYGNPSSLHMMGLEAEKLIKQAKTSIATLLTCSAHEIYFTSGGTESNNLALLGAFEANKRRGMHILATPFEHASVMETLRELQNRGAEVEWLKVNHLGEIDMKDMLEHVRQDTIIVTIMHVNNEFGNSYPIEKFAKQIKEIAPRVLFHSDGVQAVTKLERLQLKDVDLYSFSGHKIHGLKGCGGLMIRKNAHIKPIMYGGGQQNALRPGTENVLGIVALGVAIDEAKHLKSTDKIKACKDYVHQLLVEKIPGIKINGQQEASSPAILNVSLAPLRGEVLVHALEEKGIYISTGAACSSKAKIKSSILNSIGLTAEEISGTIRISFSKYNTIEECQILVDELVQATQMLRKFVRR